MEIKYQYIEKDKLFIQKYFGDFELAKFFQFSMFLRENFIELPVEAVLIDFRSLEFKDLESNTQDDIFEKVRTVAESRKEFNKPKKTTTKAKQIFWADKPMPTVIVQSFMLNLPEGDFYHYSSKERIFQRIPFTGTLADFENLMNNLEASFPESE